MHDNTIKIISCRLFGSLARGDNDKYSDMDVLIVIDIESSQHEKIKKLARKMGVSHDADISIYTRRRIFDMFNTGHLFAWHIYLESVPYFKGHEDPWFNCLERPRAYLEAKADTDQFLNILEDSLHALISGSNHIFEAGIAHMALRNIGMIQSYVHSKIPNFSRYSIMHLPSTIAPPISNESYELLLNCRRASKRGSSTLLPNKDTILDILLPLRDWIKKMRVNNEIQN